ncbi:glycosyltransferase family 4 protein [Candidatus Roizmanbacteria bacterium]|nr:glycosyltransferase family 4 protein [Candidatus Roizmanbacteria bacterium]
MNIAFINFNPLVYDVDTPYQKPLGGSESAICYLAEHLAKLGHKVILFTRFSKKSLKRGVFCLPFDKVPNDILASLDVLVVQNTPSHGSEMKKYLNEKAKLVLWTQHAHDQPAVSSLLNPKIKKTFDAFVLISRWQMDSYLFSFGLDKSKCVIIGNAIAPSFENLFSGKENLISKKSQPPVLTYTSTPFRGLDLLIRLFPAIRRAVPGTVLRVYSSMAVYQLSGKIEEEKYGNLYRLCRETEGVKYIGSIPQPKLAKELGEVSVLAYPNSFAETSCISVMEAMAAGCQVITSNLGALPETTAGFARLIPVKENWHKYSENFIRETIAFLEQFLGKDRGKIGEKLFEQTKFVNRNCTWTKKAQGWNKFLTKMFI